MQKKCEWCVGFVGDDPKMCNADATQIDKTTGSLLCDGHAEDYADVFGWECLQTIDAE